jgi:hypothetical protein
MNQLFVRVVLLCSVVVCVWYFINASKWSETTVIIPLNPNRNSPYVFGDDNGDVNTNRAGTRGVTPLNRYDVLLNKYGSTKNLTNLADVEIQLNMCNQQTGLLEVEINTLQTQLAEKKQQTFNTCQQRLKNRIAFYKRLYKGINNVEMSDRELVELENKIGIEPKTQ